MYSHDLYKYGTVSLLLYFFHPKNFHFFFKYKKLSAPSTCENFSAYLKILYNLGEVFGCSIKTDFKPTMFGFSKMFGC